MMTWNYRICSYTINRERFFGIREVHYHEDGRIRGVSEASADHWTTPDEVANTLAMMHMATTKPVLDLDALDRR